MKENRSVYKEYLESKLNSNIEITEEVIIDNFIFIFYQPEGHVNNFNDERLGINTNFGPLMVDIETGKFEIISALDFSHNYGDKVNVFKANEAKSMDLIISDVNKRKRINWSDFEEIFSLSKLDLFESAEMYSNNAMENIEFEIKNALAKDLILNFLNRINANYTLLNDNHLIVKLDI